MQDLTAFILAGGKSTRMGKDKAFLEFDGRSLLQRTLDLAHGVAPQVCIVGDPKKFASYATVVEDMFPDRGPLAGIHAALKASSTGSNLALAVDLPLLSQRFLEHLIARARTTNALVTVPRAAGHFQPLCAIYRREFANVAEQSLRAGRNKIDPLFTEVTTEILEEEELGKLGISTDIFRNLNTPEDLQNLTVSHSKAGKPNSSSFN